MGIISTVVICYKMFIYVSETRSYNENCRKVKIGMTVSEARKEMGDSTATAKTHAGIIVVRDRKNNLIDWYLEYPGEIGADEWTKIYFDPLTMKVTRISCGY